jgi:hypothetical protein
LVPYPLLLAFQGLDRCPRVSEEGTQKRFLEYGILIIFVETSRNVERYLILLTIRQQKNLKPSNLQQDE